MARWMANLPSSFTAQMALMGWLVCRVSKLTGYTIPSVGLAPGGAIEESRDNIAHCLLDMEAIADALASDNHWDRVQFAILKRMHRDLKHMFYGFRVNRSYCHRNYRSDLLMCRDHISGQFRPMVSDEEEEEGASSAKQ